MLVSRGLIFGGGLIFGILRYVSSVCLSGIFFLVSSGKALEDTRQSRQSFTSQTSLYSSAVSLTYGAYSLKSLASSVDGSPLVIRLENILLLL